MMKKYLLLSFFTLSSLSVFAKKVKFSVDLDTMKANINGVHITGDFQDEAGFPSDWDPATTQMFQEPNDTSIYSVVLDIPAFRNYEFKFVNGIFGYEAEFVPVESRVLHNFIDNRWIYVDSLSNDTQIVKPVIFGMNAPAGKNLVRFRVDMRNVPSVSPLGVHVAGAFQGWDTTAAYMHSFDGNIHEYITYVDTGNSTFEHEYKFFNGESSGTEESVPLACSNVNTNRGVNISKDTILEGVCFSSCTPCVGNSIMENEISLSTTISPNPSNGQFIISSEMKKYFVEIYNSFGEKVFSKNVNSETEALHLNVAGGIYFLRIESSGNFFSEKLIVE